MIDEPKRAGIVVSLKNDTTRAIDTGEIHRAPLQRRITELEAEVERLREALEALERWCPRDVDGLLMVNGGIYVVGEDVPQIAAVTATPGDYKPLVYTLATHKAHQRHLGERRGYWHTDSMRRASRADIETIVHEMHPDNLEEQLRLTEEIDTRRLSALYVVGALKDDRTLIVSELEHLPTDASTPAPTPGQRVEGGKVSCQVCLMMDWDITAVAVAYCCNLKKWIPVCAEHKKELGDYGPEGCP